jgi:EpsI family protein
MKKPYSLFAITVLLLMLASAGAAQALKPTRRLAADYPPIKLDEMVPKQFGQWRTDDAIVPVQVAPDVQAKLDKLYNQVLSRTYVDSAGYRIMLSIAYGGDQSDSMRAHRPEVCYAAQGFQVGKLMKTVIASLDVSLPVARLEAWQGARHEPITYWVVVGDQVARSGFEQKLAQLKFGLAGKIPDGMLVRVSSIERESASAYSRHEQFANALQQALSPRDRVRFFGRPSTG